MRWARTGRLMLSMGWETGPGVFIGWLGVTLSATLAPLLFAFGLKPLVDGLYTRRSAATWTGAAVCGVALAMVASAPSAGRWITSRIRERAIMAFQRRILTLATAAPGLAHFERPEFWNRLQVLQRGSGQLLEGTANVLVGPLVLLQLATTSAVLARLAPWLLLLPVLALPTAWLHKRSEALRRAGETDVAEGRRAAQHLFSLASESAPAKEIRVYGLSDELLRRHTAVTAGIERRIMSAEFRAFAVSGLAWIVLAAAYGAGALAALRVAGARLATPGDVALLLALATALVAASGRLSALAGQVVRAVAVSDDYHWLEEQALPRRSAAGDGSAVPPDRLVRGFELRDVSFTYPGGDRPALTGIDLTLDAGTVVAIVGENGAGKTTLVKLLSRMYVPDDGEIMLDGVDVDRFDAATYRTRISAAFQDFVRYEFLAREAVGVADVGRIADTAAVRRALVKANADFVDRLPSGMETQLGPSWESGVDLSGGEWQKLALARAMMPDGPLLMVFDEPTSSLDPQTEHALFEQIAQDTRRAASDGRVTILISHRFSTVRMADRIVVLGHGRVIEHGTHEELMAAGGPYAELYDLQARAYR